ncbi:MAG TPA: family 2B encapsulin nanocompartment shell protein [Streptosporangiaceae bacterium]
MSVEVGVEGVQDDPQLSLSTAAARNLATTTKTVPQMQGITSRWLLRLLPWVQVNAGTYRVNRRLAYATGGGKIAISVTAGQAAVVPPSLREVPLFAGLDDEETLAAIAGAFTQREAGAGATIAERGQPIAEFIVIAHGKVHRAGEGHYGQDTALGLVADGGYLGLEGLTQDASWDHTVIAATGVVLLTLSKADFQAIVDRSAALQEQIQGHHQAKAAPQNRKGEANIAITSGHSGEPLLLGTFADYELSPREYELAVAQTVLRVHTRVADLFNDPMDQLTQQLRLTTQALRERQEHEMINNRDFGLLHNADYAQRIQTHSGPPTPDDLDELLSRRRSTKMMFAHPKAIAAFGRQCSKRGLYPHATELLGSSVPAWRGVPILPCNKIPVSDGHTTSIIAVRTGEEDQGVVGLHQIGIPDEVEPGLNVRFMGINDKAVISYLVSAYYSIAVLVPDALGILEHVEVATSYS